MSARPECFCEHVECWACGGEGFHDDLYDLDPLWYSPGDTEPCRTCEGNGGWVNHEDGCENAPPPLPRARVMTDAEKIERSRRGEW